MAGEWHPDTEYLKHDPSGNIYGIKDRVTVLRGGRVVLAGADVMEHTRAGLANVMVGDGGASVLDVGDLLDDPQYRARGTFFEFANPQGFCETLYGNYVKTRRAQAPSRTGPMIGQDNEHVFRELMGLSAERYQQLVAERIIY